MSIKEDLKFTGERLIPKQNKGTAFYYEHIVRYYFASQFAKGKNVLDAGCGSGYGTYYLAKYGQAKNVHAIDIAEDAIKYAKKQYQTQNCDFKKDDILKLETVLDNSIDLAVNFEVIEHIEEQDKFLKQIKRVLTKSGIFIVSTPNKYTYKEENEFHKKELFPNEFEELLKKNFKNVTTYHQNFEFAQIIKNASKENIEIDDKYVIDSKITISKNPNEKHSQYIICVCSDEKIPTHQSLLLSTPTVDDYDITNGIQDLGDRYINLKNQFNREIEKEIMNKKEIELQIEELKKELACKNSEIENIKSSKSYKLFNRLSSIKKESKSLLKRIIVATCYVPFSIVFFISSGIAQLFISKKNIKLSNNETELNGISFIIPTWNKRDMVITCVKLLDKAITFIKKDVKAEIIVIDNGSIDETGSALKKLKLKNPLVIKSLETNIGFAKGINLGASVAKYNYLYVLNNDMEVTKSFLVPILDFAKSLIKQKKIFFGLASQIFFFDPTKRREESGKTYSIFKLGFLSVAHYVEDGSLVGKSITLYPGGGSSLLNKKLFLIFGGYDHSCYTPLYCEDLDTGVTAWSYGFPSYFIPDSKVIHHHRSSTKQLAFDPSFFMYKNWLVLLFKQMNSSQQIAQHIFLYTIRILIDKSYAKYAFEAMKNWKNLWIARLKKQSYAIKHNSNEILNFTKFEIDQKND